VSILEEILSNKRREVAQLKVTMPRERLIEKPGYARTCLSLRAALAGKDIAIIAEIKKASPSKNVIRVDFNPVKIAREYVDGGAAAISVLTDRRFFQGDIYYLTDVRPSVPVPILRKDFIVDSYQLTEAKAFGADAVLLIAAALRPEQMRALHAEATELGLECLVEVHNESELKAFDWTGISLVGINNRNLSDFSVDVATTLRIASLLPPGVTIVSESGISGRADIEALAEHGIHAVLIGETLMRAPRPGEKLRSLLSPAEKNIR
jgi:indole-3-glycerol phosphate synthase